MNFNYSYRAFLITCLLFGILFTILFGFKLKSKILEQEENNSIEYALNILEEEEDLAQNTHETVSVETNRAFNEAEKFIRQLENERMAEEESAQEITESESKTDNLEGASELGTKVKAKKISEKKKSTASKSSTAKTAAKSGANSRTTIRYHLVDRSALALPNPVYTCMAGGKVVISIEVDEMGRVVKTSYNKKASTTQNGCLIDSAIEYAQSARFNTRGGKKKQIGTITYNFPGQN